ncbi:MAG: VOC family protein [Pseudomonadota bacterium]
MNIGRLEHTNLTLPDPRAFADLLCRIFGWHIRWEGHALDGGLTVHVGEQNSYLAIYQPADGMVEPTGNSYHTTGGLNHLGVVVDDLATIEDRVKAEGLVPNKHQDYEPGERFYFDTQDGIEIEVISYS